MDAGGGGGRVGEGAGKTLLPADFRRGDPIDVYAVDRLYFESFWHVPPGAPRLKLYDNPFPYPGIEHDNETPETLF